MQKGDDFLFEQDYIVRLIKEMIRTILKLLFHIDTDTPTAELLSEADERETLDHLLDLIDDGNINEAENEVYELISDGNASAFEIALLFYSYLNDKTDDFLKENDFSREEIHEGLKNIVSECGLSSLADIFLTE